MPRLKTHQKKGHYCKLKDGHVLHSSSMVIFSSMSKVILLLFSSITFNEFTVKDSFAFAEEIVHQDSKLYMGSLDVDSLFTNIPLEEN